MANGNDNSGGGGNKKNTSEMADQKALAQAILDREKETVDALRQKNEQLAAAVQTMSALDNVAMSNQRRAERTNELVEAKLEIENNILKIMELEFETAKQNKELTDQQIQAYETQLASQREITTELNAQLYLTEGMADAQGDIASAALKFAGITGKMNLTAKFAGMVGQTGSLKQAFADLADEIGNTASKAMLINATSQKISQGIGAIVMMMIEQAMALDKVLSQTTQTLNVNRAYASSIDEVYQAQKLNGLTAEQASESFNSLHTQMSSFSQQSATMRTTITETGAQLSQLGVSSQSFATGMDMSVQALRMSADEARRAQTDLARFAGDLGMAPETMAAGFAQAGPHLAKFGNNAVKSFKNVAKAAKETGIEMNRIMDYTAQFDTFEGAAERVGALNAALGGDYLNTMDLMEETDPAKRIQMITDAISASGKSFEEMGYYEKQMFAQAGGFADVEELSRAMSGSLDDNATSTAENAMSQEELARINRENLSLQQKMAATLAELAPGIMKIVAVFHKLMIPVMKFVEYGGAYVLPLLIALRAHFFFLQMQQAANVRQITAHQLAQIRKNSTDAAGNAITYTSIAASIKKSVVSGAETVALYALEAADKAKALATAFSNTVQQKGIAGTITMIALKAKDNAMTLAGAIAAGGAAAAMGIWNLAKGAYNIVTGISVVTTLAFGKALIIATGGIILLIPLIIGIIAGLKAMWEKGGMAKGIVIALGLAIAAMLGPIGWAIAAIILLVKNWDTVKAALWSTWEAVKWVGEKLFYVLTFPFQMAYKYIMSVWEFFMGSSPSPFAQSMVDGIASVGKAILNFLTWPYRKAWGIITGIWDSIVGFFREHWETIKSIAISAITIIGRIWLAVLTGGMSEVILFIYENWEGVKAFFASIADWVYQKFAAIAGVGRIILKALKFPFNVLIKMVNSMLAGLEKVFTLIIRVPKILPGPSKYQIGPPSLGRIPELAKGTDNFEGGTALVGEQGAELVNMPQGSTVSPANKTKNFGETLAKVAANTARMAAGIAKFTPAGSAVNAVAGAVAGVGGGTGGKQQPVTINVTLELDKRVLARHVEEVMVDRLNPANA